MLLRPALLSLLVLALLAACDEKKAAPPPASAGAAPSEAPAGPPRPRRVTGAQAREAVAAGATLLDVRTADEFNATHLPGAMNIPAGELARSMGSVPKGKPVVVYGAAGSGAAAASVILARAGFEVMNLGGIGDWGP
jgi:rhodanese-related sulfurtransferase